jgi:hypothetical protein
MTNDQIELLNKLGIVRIESKVQYFTKEQLLAKGVTEESLIDVENKCIVSFSCINVNKKEDELSDIERIINPTYCYSSQFLEFKNLIIEFNDNLFLSKEEKQKIIDEYKSTNTI